MINLRKLESEPFPAIIGKSFKIQTFHFFKNHYKTFIIEPTHSHISFIKEKTKNHITLKVKKKKSEEKTSHIAIFLLYPLVI